MKKPTMISIGLSIAIALLGLFMFINHPEKTPTETNTPSSTENTEHFEDEHEHDDEHDHSVEIEGNEIKLLTVQEIAALWQIDSEELLGRIIQEFDFKENYTTETTLEEMRNEYKFSPAIIKDIAEEIKNQDKN